MAHSACLTTQAASVRDLLNTDVHLAPHEAVAIVQQLLASRGEEADERLATADDVLLDGDGVAVCREGATSVEAIGRLLDAMLPCGNGQRVPGALRFTIARACNSADAPPFASRAELSAVLERFEWSNREDVVREVLARATPVWPAAPSDARRADRRRQVDVSDLRRELRKADERVFALVQATTPEFVPLAATADGRSRAWWAAVVVGAVTGSFAAGYALTELMAGAVR